MRSILKTKDSKSKYNLKGKAKMKPEQKSDGAIVAVKTGPEIAG